MTKLVLAAATLATLMAFATSPTIAEGPATVGTEVFDWSGFYIGVNLGAASTPDNATSNNGPLLTA